MLLTIECSKFKFDSKEFNKTLQKALETQMRQAAREFVRETLRRIPYRTGFLRGAFAPLLQLLKVAAPAPPPGSTPLDSRGRPKKLYREYYQKKILKTPAAGAQFGTEPGEIFTNTEDQWLFNYSVLIIYYRINDVYTSRSPTSPWRSMETGRNAFINYMKTTGISKLPKVTKFILKTKIKLKGNKMFEQTSERITP